LPARSPPHARAAAVREPHLLEADVELGVTKRFLARVKEKAVGQTVKTQVAAKGRKVRVGPAERFIKVCQEELEAMMATDGAPLELEKRPKISGIMLLGLQGAGKTTTAAKLALWLEKERGRKVLLVAADTQRPGAVDQLQKLGAIRYQRGRITVLDRPSLEQLCCECYAVVKKETDRLETLTAIRSE